MANPKFGTNTALVDYKGDIIGQVRVEGKTIQVFYIKGYKVELIPSTITSKKIS